VKPFFIVKIQKSLDSFVQTSEEKINLEIINDDAKNVLDYIPNESIDLIFTSPPYANILNKERTNKSKHTSKRKDSRLGEKEQYSDDPRDLDTQQPNNFIKSLKEISANLYKVLKPKKHYIVNIRDVVPFFIQLPLIKAMDEISFKLKNIIIWDKRKLIQRMGIFGWPYNFIVLNSAYEYIFDFIKT